MATYPELQQWIKERHGFTVKNCWIAHAKELNGMPLGKAPNRQGEQRVFPCPPEKLPVITEAFRHFGMLP